MPSIALPPYKLKRLAATWAFGTFLLSAIGEDYIREHGIRYRFILAFIALPPTVMWLAAKWMEARSPVTDSEARALIAQLGTLLAPNPTQRLSPSSLPAPLQRMKRAFATMVPIAVAQGDTEYLSALQTAYTLLANFAPAGHNHLAEAVALSAEFQSLLGQQSSISASADTFRQAVKEIGAEFSLKEATESVMRQVASAELLAKRKQSATDNR